MLALAEARNIDAGDLYIRSVCFQVSMTGNTVAVAHLRQKYCAAMLDVALGAARLEIQLSRIERESRMIRTRVTFFARAIAYACEPLIVALGAIALEDRVRSGKGRVREDFLVAAFPVY